MVKTELSGTKRVKGRGRATCACVGVWALRAGTLPVEPDSAFTLVVEGGAVGDPMRAPCLWWPSDQGFVWKHRAKQGRGELTVGQGSHFCLSPLLTSCVLG